MKHMNHEMYNVQDKYVKETIVKPCYMSKTTLTMYMYTNIAEEVADHGHCHMFPCKTTQYSSRTV